ncbi:microfibrillar-associated protein 1-like [Chenopodium quinoa]|uniref:microfibrillar-associated protein 1-like n=1 Tax=Chenopodium quinoa TaxID=63459 RepID=UPI000B78D2B1|nr:microfibrillar-associated protein 1-like [Chenopodium quinoa]
MSVTADVSDTIIAIREKLRGKIGQTKVKRYWPGKAPEWADEVEEEADLRTLSRRQTLEHAFPVNEDTTFTRGDDPRLRRLAENRAENKEEVRADHRRIRQAEIVSTEEEENRAEEAAAEEKDDDDALEERRRKIRERLLQRRQEEEKQSAPIEEEDDEAEEESEEEESEYETDSEEEEMNQLKLAKPVFVPKQERETIAERERVEAEEQALEEAVKRRLEERKVETKQIVVEKIREYEVIQKNLEAEADIADIDTDDEVNEAEEYESWKAREIARIKRDREDREAMVKEKEEIERVRNMTEEERREWERKNPKNAPQPKQKWRFMQKYYHKGAFFQEDPDDRAGTAGGDTIFRRDFSEPTGDDKLDKTILPKVMQVKHFGRSGRTKWTHLVNEDTTDWNNPWTYNDPLRAKYNAKMAGMNKPIAKPKGSKKLKDWEQK